MQFTLIENVSHNNDNFKIILTLNNFIHFRKIDLSHPVSFILPLIIQKYITGFIKT